MTLKAKRLQLKLSNSLVFYKKRNMNLYFQSRYFALELALEPIPVSVKNAQSKADFVNKLTIALKEADETQYWLELLYESQIIEQNLFDSLNKELKEIIAIITSSIKTAKNKH